MLGRQMQAEFERLVQLINPEYIITKKLDSDTIFYFLNVAQDRFIKQNYLSIDNTRGSHEHLKKNTDAFKSLITTVTTATAGTAQVDTITISIANPAASQTDTITINGIAIPVTSDATPTVAEVRTALISAINSSAQAANVTATAGSDIIITSDAIGVGFSDTVSANLAKTNTVANAEPSISNQSANSYALPSNFFLYLRSSCLVTGTYMNITTPASVPNKFITQDDVENISVSYFNSPILRQPCALLTDETLDIYHDSLTVLTACTMTYIRKPLKITHTTVVTDVSTLTCELSSNVHQEIVELAVDIFISEAAYRIGMKPNKQKED